MRGAADGRDLERAAEPGWRNRVTVIVNHASERGLVVLLKRISHDAWDAALGQGVSDGPVKAVNRTRCVCRRRTVCIEDEQRSTGSCGADCAQADQSRDADREALCPSNE